MCLWLRSRRLRASRQVAEIAWLQEDGDPGHLLALESARVYARALRFLYDLPIPDAFLADR